MTPVEIRGVKVVTRDAPKIYKNCQRGSAVRNEKISRQISTKYSSLLASSFQVRNNFSRVAYEDNGGTFSAVSCAATFRIRD